MIYCVWKNIFLDLFFIASVCYTIGSEKENITAEESDNSYSEDVNNQLEYWNFCQSANLKILPIADIPMNTLTVTFMLTNEKFKNCFTYFDIFLEQKRRTINAAKVEYKYDLEKKGSYTFFNVSCGVYEVVIQPCYSDWQCAYLKIRYPKLINMSTADCFNLSWKENDNLVSTEGIKTDFIILAAVICVLFTFISGLVYYCYWTYFKNRHTSAKEALYEKRAEEKRNEEEKILVKSIDVFIFHYYDKNEQVKKKAKIFRDFLLRTSFFNSVKLIETELVEISQNAFDWLNKTLEEENEDGSVVKIIIIDSMEDDQVEESEIENYICTQLFDRLGNNLSRSLEDYDNLFVVRFDGYQAYSRRIANFVRGHRFLLSNYHHLVDLCVILCSGSGIRTQEIEEKIGELYFKHEVRNLGLVQRV